MQHEPPKSKAHDEDTIKLLGLALAEFQREGKVTTVRCDVCGGVIEIKWQGHIGGSVNCPCGRFKDNLRGI